MAGWLALAKVIAPHVSTIVSAALPALTRHRPEEAGPAGQTATTGLVQQQIDELQTAVTTNDAHIRELAEQLRTTVELLDRRAVAATRRMRRLYLVSIGAAVLSAVAVLLALAAHI